MESKNKTIEEGVGQCAAEMYAARLYNQQNGEDCDTIYGAVTNASEWLFLKLEDDQVLINKNRYYLGNLKELLSVFQFIINQYK